MTVLNTCKLLFHISQEFIFIRIPKIESYIQNLIEVVNKTLLDTFTNTKIGKVAVKEKHRTNFVDYTKNTKESVRVSPNKQIF